MSAETRIRRLRWRLTALFALTSALGLIGLAAFAIHNDDRSWRNEVDDSLKLQASRAIEQLNYDSNGRLDASELVGDGDSYCPSLTVMSYANHQVSVAHAPQKPCVRVRAADLHSAAVTATDRWISVLTDVTSNEGHPVRLLAEPFAGPVDDGTPGGAIVAAVDTASYQAGHRNLALLLVGGCVVLVALSAVAGHLLSGRAITPALTGLRQQEAFLADAAHDLRTPVASLRALAETSLRDEVARTAALQRTVRLASRMGELIDGLLTRARLMAGVNTLDRQRLRLDQLVEAVVEDTDTAEHRVAVRAEPAVVLADADLLRRAVTNLLSNALAHGHAPETAAEVVLTVTADGTLTVDDAGPGVPADVADSLFERFRSGADSTGLGLSIASWVAHVHGGTLTVGASPRGGARFTLRLDGQRR